MAEQAAKTFFERMLTAFFAGWTPSDRLAFVYFAAGIALVSAGKIDAKELMTFAWGFLAGRSESYGYQAMGYAGSYGPYPQYPYPGGNPVPPVDSEP